MAHNNQLQIAIGGREKGSIGLIGNLVRVIDGK